MKTTLHLLSPVILAWFLLPLNAKGQPAIEWQKCLGGTGWDVGCPAKQTNDGGYIVAGYTMSNNGDVSGNHGAFDVWLVRLDSTGNLVWQKAMGGSGFDYAFSVDLTTDGGYIIAGETDSHNGDVTGNHGQSYDFWVVKVDAQGSLQWQKCLGGSGGETANSVIQTNDGGFIVAGMSWLSDDGDVTGNHGDFDYWVVKLDASGNIQWQKCLGGSGRETARCIIQSSDGGFVVVGDSDSNDGDVHGNHGNSDAWIVKLNSTGDILWQKSLGGSNNEIAFSVQQAVDQGYIIACNTLSNDGDVTGIHSSAGLYGDTWVVKLDDTGNLQWQKCLGGSYDDLGHSVQQTFDGGYVAASITNSNDGDVTGNHDPTGSNWDYWIAKLDGSGNLEWQECIGGSDIDEAKSVQQTTDGGLVIGGVSYSNNGDITGTHGSGDYWIVKLQSLYLEREEILHNEMSVFPNPATHDLYVSLSQKANISVLNIQGQEIMKLSAKAGVTNLDVSMLAKGVYFLMIRADNGLFVRKFLRQE